MADTRNYCCLTLVHHDGKAYPIGRKIVLEAEAAEALLAVNAIEALAKSKVADTSADTPADDTAPPA